MDRSEANVPAAAVLAPHAPLTQYYGEASGQKSGFLRGIFDRTAIDYDRVERFMALGTGSWYRRQALLRAGLAPGMKVLDVAAGTGMVAREAVHVVGDSKHVIRLDPSAGILAQLVPPVPHPLIRGPGGALPPPA